MGNTVDAPARKLSLQDFDLVRLVGKGAFGKVWQVRQKDTGDIYAMKVLAKRTIVEQNLVQHTVFERDVMLLCNNPFIVNLYYAFQTSESLYFILDFIGGGSLFTVLRDHPHGYFPEAQARFYAAEILLGLEELHRNEIVYRDLKLENVLLGTDGHIVLTDFGLSARLDKDEKLHSFSGTAIYIAPEVLLGEGHDKSVDWWSYGVLLHLLLTGEPPFWSENRRELFEMIILHDAIIDDPLLSPQSRDLIYKLLNKDKESRLGCTLGAVEIKKHAFFAGINWSHVAKKKLKPPLIPSEFLLTTRNVPPCAPPPPPPSEPSEQTDSGSGSTEIDLSDVSSEISNSKLPVNIDRFDGFSFARSDQKTTSEMMNRIALISHDFKSQKKRKLKRLAFPGLEKLTLLDSQAKEKSSTFDSGKPSEVFTPQKLELLREQAARDNRNRTFIEVGNGSEALRKSNPVCSGPKSGSCILSSSDSIMNDSPAPAERGFSTPLDPTTSPDGVRIRHKKTSKSKRKSNRLRRTASTGTVRAIARSATDTASMKCERSPSPSRVSSGFHSP